MLVSVGIVAHAQGADPIDDITYPIAELDNCGSESECLAYCDEPGNLGQCLDFAEAHSLMTPGEIEHARVFQSIGAIGPGGCTGQEECEIYCDDIAHIDECIAFGEEHGLIPPGELEEAKKVAEALQAGATLPGGCSSKDECEVYCEDPGHIDECIAFAEAAGFMHPDELEEAKKFADLMKEGDTPGGCRGKEECEAYCDSDRHFEECILFAEKAGVIPPEELEMIKKTGGRGPGGCRGRDECDAFCNNTANQEACFAFAQEHGLLSDKDLARSREGIDRIQEGLSHASPEVLSCLEERLGNATLAEIRSGDFFPSPTVGEAMKGCFEQFGGPGPGEEGRIQEALSFANPGTLNCIERELGPDSFARIQRGDLSGLGPQTGEIFQGCFERFMQHDESEEFPVDHGDIPVLEDGVFPSDIPSGFIPEHDGTSVPDIHDIPIVPDHIDIPDGIQLPPVGSEIPDDFSHPEDSNLFKKFIPSDPTQSGINLNLPLSNILNAFQHSF
tara:strand:+ start:1084 stop:2592 length:1509 start_codon:yes stop_codon:yes gene_type:complete